MKVEINNINIVCVCDNHFTILLGALLKSIEMNYLGQDEIHFHIVEDNVSDENRRKVESCIENNLISIHWIKMNEIIESNISLPSDSSSFPLNVYLRILIPHFLEDSIKKVIYLDVDMIVVKDISELWSMELGNHPVAGVLDRSLTVSNPWGGIKNYQELGLDKGVKYFNSGMLLMNLELWRKEELAKKIIKCVNDNIKYASFPDQYGLNVVLANRWKELDSKWNCFAISEEPDPFIIHFIGNKPIYSTYKFNKNYKRIFFTYLESTPWKGFQPYNNYHRYLKKIANKIKKIFN